jgi:cytochrome c oxidase subunit II
MRARSMAAAACGVVLSVGGMVAAPGDGLRANGPAASGTAAAREVTVTARQYAFQPSRIEVDHGELVTIRLLSEDRAYSFAVDEYRISKRFSPRHPAPIEFHADRRGTFSFYCNLTADEGCRTMRGTLDVR